MNLMSRRKANKVPITCSLLLSWLACWDKQNGQNCSNVVYSINFIIMYTFSMLSIALSHIMPTSCNINNCSEVRKMSSTKYEKYRIPPDFDLAVRHAMSCKLYRPSSDVELADTGNKCGCCNQLIGTAPVGMCEYVSSLRRIGEQVPLFFNFITLMITLTIFIIFVKAGEFLFFCDSCELVNHKFEDFWGINMELVLGFRNPSNLIMMIEIIVYAVVIIIIKVHLKTKKYKYRAFNYAIEKRSVQLINLPKNCTQKDIRGLLRGYHIEEVVFTYRVKEYRKCMLKIAKLKKGLKYLQSRMQRDEQNTRILEQKLDETKRQLQVIIKGIGSKQKRLSIAFVIFQTQGEKHKALKQFHYNFLTKAFCKLCVCCSKNNIRGLHVTVKSAQAPDDIKWENLENPYLRTKIYRFLSFMVCSVILIFGIVSQVLVFNKQNVYIESQSSTGQFLASLVIFVINFLIINFLEGSTNNIEAHQSNTDMKLSLIRKITFFMFINVSVSPFLIMIYNKVIVEIPLVDVYQTIGLTIILVCLGNFIKPFFTLFSVHRFLGWYKCYKQKAKKKSCRLNQLEANQLFEPMQFPIQVYYSLMHASLMMAFFYLGCFQFVFIVELPALVLLYFIAKWMLLRVCKQPRGLSLKLNNLAQSLMRFYLPLYWLGRNFIAIVSLSDDQFSAGTALRKIVYEDMYQIVSTSVIGALLLCEVLVAKIAKVLAPQKQTELSEYFSAVEHNRTYSEANLFFKIHEEDMAQPIIRVPKNNEESEESGNFTRDKLY